MFQELSNVWLKILFKTFVTNKSEIEINGIVKLFEIYNYYCLIFIIKIAQYLNVMYMAFNI